MASLTPHRFLQLSLKGEQKLNLPLNNSSWGWRKSGEVVQYAVSYFLIAPSH